ncbi:MAG: arginine--tRNA ligase [Gammaproteobacteria bacterium]|jgi:arginyl-tRNA synthetase|tara:strand:+ start:679 stop:2418 length:1740 start_codon:yes stop_codon:yes gene_type:complete
MNTLKHTLNKLVGEALSVVSGLTDCDPNVITASKPEFGDYQSNGIMSIAKKVGTNPRQLASDVVEKITADANPLIAKLEVAGPGFINIHLSDTALMQRASEIQNDTRKLIPTTNKVDKIVVDYSSPNLAKEMHVGHLRGTIIGDCLARVLERQGHEIIRQNHVGDWGTQFGMLICYMRELSVLQGDLPTQLADLESFYRAAKERFDADPEFADTARGSVVKLQGGDADHLVVWQQFIDESLKHCQALYDKLNVTLSRKDLKAESFYNKDLEGVVKKLEEASLLSISNGARCVFLPEFTGKDGEPLPVIIQKTDGGYLYATTDLAAVQFRSFDLKAERSLYVVDARQSLHFQQVFAVGRKAGFASENISLEHIAYGTMMGSDGRPFKTRSGDTIKLVDLLDEAIRRAHELVSKKNPGLDETTYLEIAEKVGIAAVKYADLSKNRTSDYVFDWSSMLSFEGNTAPYLMYAYARIRSILRKQNSGLQGVQITSVSEVAERNLLLKIMQLSEVVDMVARDCYPNLLCNYLYELAGMFMRFYESCPILKADAQLRDSRLALSALTAATLHQGLDLLGIETLEKM